MIYYPFTCAVVCEDNQLRVVGGITVFEGRVELCISETWNTICADNAWTNNDANVACREAGYSATGTVHAWSLYIIIILYN